LYIALESFSLYDEELQKIKEID